MVLFLLLTIIYEETEVHKLIWFGITYRSDVYYSKLIVLF